MSQPNGGREQMAEARPRDVIVTLAWETFADLELRRWNRPPDRLIREMLANPRIRKLAVTEPARNPLIAVARSRRYGSSTLPVATIREGRTFVSLRHYGLRRAIRPRRRIVGTADALKDMVVAQGMNAPVVITTDPRIAGFCDLNFASRVVYFARDDWAEHHGYRKQHREIVAAYDAIRGRGIDVAAVSRVLLERIGTTGRSLLLPNGIDPGEWSDPGPPPPWFSALPGPRVVYVGSIDERLDPTWIAAAAGSMGGGSIVLAGPHMDAGVVAALSRIDGVVLPGLIEERQDVVGVVSGADAAILPHVASPLTEAMDPLKMYEYLAAGRPVAASDLPPVRGFGERVALTATATDAGQAVKAALALSPVREDDRRRFIGANTWKTRADVLLDFAFPAP